MAVGILDHLGFSALEAGMDDYVSKPVTPGAIDKVLTRWLGSPIDQVTTVEP